jgi:2-polyprenyl-3-methyl-5-hydroxy-6-metoxy-1,4-benzoquinol methylase
MMGIFSRYKEKLNFLKTRADKREVDALYKLLYKLVHDVDESLDLTSNQTEDSFSFQWDQLAEGEYMLSDSWFKNDVERIICEEEILIDKSWFKGKKILDAGCGGGRWSYGLAKLGASITAVDINESALRRTKEAIKDLDPNSKFVQTPLENLDKALTDSGKFDLVWSWGVVHHCKSFTKAFDQVCNQVKEGGLIYLYLYGRESLAMEADLNLFKDRVYYNSLSSWEEKESFLIEKGNGNPERVHQMHDIYSPLLNRRLEFDFVKKLLEAKGFTSISRTNNSTELHIRAVKGTKPDDLDQYILAPFVGESWMNHHEQKKAK